MLGIDILHAKLNRPSSRSTWVERPELDEHLNHGLSGRLTLISAPPGFGKTTAIAQWLDTLDQPTAWLTLDRLDNNLETFVSYLLASLQTAFPDAGHLTATHLQSPQEVPANILADALIEDMAELSDALVIALDDYHLIKDGDVEAFMERLIQFLPTNIHLILIGRTDPPLSLSRLRARGDVAEVRAADLQFSFDEARLLLSRLAGEPVDVESASLLSTQTEGWVLGLQFAVLARHRGETIASVANRLGLESHHLVVDYLVDEVLAQQPIQVQDFLVRSSILERLCAPLCQAVLDRPGQESMLDYLWRSDLLIIPLDDRRTWFRYHSLFRETLRRRLLATTPAEAVQELNRRAAGWLAAEGFIGEAINHALAAGGTDMAVRFVADNLHSTLNREEWWRIARWLDQLPEAAQHHPIILIARGWLGIASHRVAAVAQVIIEAETKLVALDLPSAERISLQAQIDTQKAMVAYWRGDSETSLTLVERALAIFSPESTWALGIAYFYKGIAQYAAGRSAEASAYFQGAIDAHMNGEDALLGRLLLGQCSINMDSGNLPALKRSGTLMGKIGARSNLQNTQGWAIFANGFIAYEENDLSPAERSLWQIVNSPHRYNSRTAYESYLILALTLQAQGKPNAADDVLNRLQDFLLETNNLHALPLVQAMECDLALMRGKPIFLLPVAPLNVREAVADLHLSFTVSSHLTQARCLIAQGTAACLQAASTYLAVMRQAAESHHLQRRLVKILALEALVAAGIGDDAGAQDRLRQSLELAKAGNLIRTFVDCGPALVPLLENLRMAGLAANYVEHILGAFAGMAAQETKRITTTYDEDLIFQLKSSLTNREQEVLLLLAKRMSNKEVAAELVLAPQTVKKYTARIYQKLGVNNRRAAVGLAERIGLLAVL